MRLNTAGMVLCAAAAVIAGPSMQAVSSKECTANCAASRAPVASAHDVGSRLAGSSGRGPYFAHARGSCSLSAIVAGETCLYGYLVKLA